jgi:hypothetical protein
MNESMLDMMQLDSRLETLQFQIYAYQKSKQMDHQPLMNFNIDAIQTLCNDISYRIKAAKHDPA